MTVPQADQRPGEKHSIRNRPGDLTALRSWPVLWSGRASQSEQPVSEAPHQPPHPRVVLDMLTEWGLAAFCL